MNEPDIGGAGIGIVDETDIGYARPDRQCLQGIVDLGLAEGECRPLVIETNLDRAAGPKNRSPW